MGLGGTTAILVTPLQGGPSKVFNLPLAPSPTITLPKTPTLQPPAFLTLSSKPPPPLELLINKSEPEVLIKSEPMDQSVPDEPETIVSEPLNTEADQTDIITLTQTLDLVTLQPRTAGELTSAEKYIIKSR